MERNMNAILEELSGVLEQVDYESIHEVTDQLLKAKRIFVSGEGRSGLMAKAFAMRLMHLGANSFVVGETTTPSLETGDTVVLISGSGKTKSVVWTAEVARGLGCEVIALTTNLESPLALESGSVVHVPAATKYRRENEKASVQPLGSLFDQSIHMILDYVCLEYAQKQKLEHEAVFQKHSNLE
ncbi:MULTISPECIES: 6-phospho-3-hexuloisomerase [unclassified Bacillus (in: firmicutes)]|uniref:6-phospho-3-hexuloisomerase n=1 Tax=unclassified Bacillus (in: firmicutes) TaxID=185979 RepID=UPI0008EC3C30|nr:MULTISPECIES: 6-phospho-3-hexuloisomerase [unclassified Bacillus (in: firmicutes)]SFB20343.1 6-phospho-3-hexuloisomerase [Bacillus sp. UNCCL13]SFQ90859.1 6-phospho-3-hexuloisomerase [Bacillus sp. cl95]